MHSDQDLLTNILITYHGLEGLSLEIRPAAPNRPLDLLLINRGDCRVVASLLFYEGVLRENYRGDYRGHLRDGHIFDRKVFSGDVLPLGQPDPARRARLLSDSESLINPGDLYLLTAEGRSQRIEAESPLPVDPAGEPFTFHDLSNYQRINIYLSVALDSGTFHGPHARDLSQHTTEVIESIIEASRQMDGVSREEALEELYESQLGGFSATIKLIPNSPELRVKNPDVWREFGLTDEDFRRLRSLGLTGTLDVTGCSANGLPPFKSRALLISTSPLTEAVALPQPDGCEVIYYQVNGEWKKEPAEAPVLRKCFRLYPDPVRREQTMIWSEAYVGSKAGGGGGAFDFGAEMLTSESAEAGLEAHCSIAGEGDGGVAIFEATAFYKDGQPPPPPQPRDEMALIVEGAEEHGLTLEPVYGRERPSDLLLTNGTDSYLLAFLLFYECVLRDDMKEPDKLKYGRELRGWEVIERPYLWAPHPSVWRLGEEERRRQLRSMRPTIAPHSRWLIGWGRDVRRVTTECPTLEETLAEYPMLFYDLAEFKEIRVTFTAMFEDGRVVGPQMERFQRELWKWLERREDEERRLTPFFGEGL